MRQLYERWQSSQFAIQWTRVKIILVFAILLGVVFVGWLMSRGGDSSTPETHAGSDPLKNVPTRAQGPTRTFDPSLPGKDPVDTGCDDSANTLAIADISDSDGIKIGFVELRFSDECSTYWSTVETDDGASSHDLTVYLKDQKNVELLETKYDLTFNSAYGDMWGSDDLSIRVRACGVIDGHENCTALMR